MARKTIKAKNQEIADYWFARVDESDLSVDASEAHERCWRCGCKRGLQRCHIIPDSLGGSAEPSNLVLLCSRCHLDNPNVVDPEIMWDWIRAYKVPFYDTFWYAQGMREYEFIYKKSLIEEFKARNIVGFEGIEAFNEVVREEAQKATYHFGDPHLNIATLAGVIRMALKRYDEEQGVNRPTERE